MCRLQCRTTTTTLLSFKLSLRLIHLNASPALHKHSLTDVGDPKIRCRLAVISEVQTISRPASHGLRWWWPRLASHTFVTVTTQVRVLLSHSESHQIRVNKHKSRTEIYQTSLFPPHRKMLPSLTLCWARFQLKLELKLSPNQQKWIFWSQNNNFK